MTDGSGALISHLSAKGRQNGLDMDLSIPTPEILPEFEVSGTLRINPNDISDFKEITYTAMVAVYESNQYKVSHLSDRPVTESRQIVNNLINGTHTKRFFREKISYKKIVDSINTGVKNELIEELNLQNMQPAGWTIKWMKLGFQADKIDIPTEITHHTECIIRDYSKGITVSHTMLVTVEDASKLHLSGIT